MERTLFTRVLRPALIGALASLFVVPSAVLAVTTVTATPAAAATDNGADVVPGGLVVSTAENSSAYGQGDTNAPQQGALVQHYKWIINVDPTGDPHQPNGDQICHPQTPTNTNGNPNFPDAPPAGALPVTAPNTAYAPCQWPSVHQLQSSQLISSGTDADWNTTMAIPMYDTKTKRGLPDGKYLVSVLANGYQLGGSHFSVVNGQIQGSPAIVNPSPNPTSFVGSTTNGGGVGVNLNPWPLPLATARLKVYQDMASANSQWDEQTEPGIAGFTARLSDFDGQITADYYGNPLCTAYRTTQGVNAATGQPMGDTELGLDGRPVVDPTHHWAGIALVPGPSIGQCVSDANGEIAVPNLAPNRYGMQVVAPPESDPTHGVYKLCPTQDTTPNTNYPVLSEKCWTQTDTIEGGHEIDVWLMANDSGLDNEQVVGGEPVPWVRYGYVLAGCMDSSKLRVPDGRTVGAGIDPSLYNAPNACLVDTTGGDPTQGGVFPHATNTTPPTFTSTITGRITGANAYIPGVGGLPGLTTGTAGTSGFKLEPQPLADECKTVAAANCQYVKHAWVALSDNNNNDKTEYVMPADQYGNFIIKGVPDGTYTLSLWDQPQDYIFDSFTVNVTGSTDTTSTHTLALGQLPLLQWFTRIYGHVYIDTNGNGRQDPGEPGVPKLVLQNLNRTNNLYEQGQNIAKTDTNGYYEFTEAYPLGADNVEQFFFTRYKTTGITYQACNDPQEHTYPTAAVDVSLLGIISQCVRVDVGIQPYATGQNGGIVATVVNETVRNRYLGRQQIQYDHMVGVPGVQTELFQAVKDPVTGKFEKNCANDPSTAPAGTDYLTTGVCTTDTTHDGSYLTTGNDPAAPGGYTAADRAPGAPNVYNSEHYGKAAPLQPNGLWQKSATGYSVQGYTSDTPNPAQCVARDANGNVLQGKFVGGGASGMVTGDGNAGTPTFQDSLPGLKPDGTQACIEAPITGINLQFGSDNQPVDPTNTAACTPVIDLTHPNLPPTYDLTTCALHGVQTVDGNYTLTPGHTDKVTKAFVPDAGDYLTKVDIPGDTVLGQVDKADRPLYKVSTEQDINVFGPAQGLAPFNDPNASTAQPGITPEWVPQGGIDWTHAYNADGTTVSITGASGSVFSWPPRAAAPNPMHPAIATPTADSPSTDIENPGTYSPAPEFQCAGSQFTVNVAGTGTNIPATNPNNQTSPAQISKGRNPKIANSADSNANAFLAAGGSPVDGLTRNLCDVHLIHVENGQSVAPNFYVYTDVPIPAMYQVQIFDDVSTSVDRRSTQYGEVAGIPNAPVGVYDFRGNLLYKQDSDPNGVLEVLMPSTDMTNCPTSPAAECSNVYRFVGNDPGTPDQPNANWNPQYSTIAAQFQAMPGIFEPADVAPVRGAAAVTQPDAAYNVFSACQAPATKPQFFAVNRPYTFLRGVRDPVDQLVIYGTNLGTGGTVSLGAVTLPGASIVSWSPTQITVNLDTSRTSGINPGSYQLTITPTGAAPLNALTYHVIGTRGQSSYNPTVYEVGTDNTPQAGHAVPADRQFTYTQDALEAAAGYQVRIVTGGYSDVRRGRPAAQALVVVFPLAPTAFAPLSARYEDIVLHSNVKVQGVGPGGYQPPVNSGGAQVTVPGTIFDGRFFTSLYDHVVDGDPFIPIQVPPSAAVSQYAEHALQLWYAVMSGTPLSTDTFATDNKVINEGQIVTVLGNQRINNANSYTAAFPPTIDGVGLTGAEAVNFPTNINGNTGNKTGPSSVPTTEQGGAILLNAHADYTQITNDAIYSAAGSYGSVRIGTPQLFGQHNYHVTIANDQITADSGTNLAGAVGLFNGSSGYSIHDNNFCGNSSAEYGGAISQNGFGGQEFLDGSLSVSGGTVANGVHTVNGSQTVTLPNAAPAFFTNAMVGSRVTGLSIPANSYVGAVNNPRSISLSSSPTANVRRNATVTNPNGTLTVATVWKLTSASAAFSAADLNPPVVVAATNLNATISSLRGNTATLSNGPTDGLAVNRRFEFGLTRDVNSIDHNVVELSNSYDEGGGIAVAGELNVANNAASVGTGPVDITRNVIAANLGNDDGGGIRFLMAGNFPMHVANDIITNNVSTHEGGGIAIDDTPQVYLVNDTIAKNITTATAATSDGTPAPAGVSTAANSAALQAMLPPTAPVFSEPVVQNDVFFDNRAGTWTPSGVTGIGLTGDNTPINFWDLGTADHSGLLEPAGSYLTSTQGYSNPLTAANLVFGLPASGLMPNPLGFMQAYDTGISITAIRNSIRFRPSAIVNFTLPTDVVGDYHVASGSLALGLGFFTWTPALPPTLTSTAPSADIDSNVRPVPNPAPPKAPTNHPGAGATWTK